MMLPVLPMALLAAMLLAPAFATDEPQMDTDELLLKHSFEKPYQNRTPLQTGAQKLGESQPGPVTPGQPLVITGQVQTLQQAIESEKDFVDWYAWYMGAREYLSRTGGLQCSLGTPIKFYREGRIEAMTFDPVCRESVSNKIFPLPRKTRLDALILPVRNGSGPPATPNELYNRINALQPK